MNEPDLVAGSIRLWRVPAKVEVIIEPVPPVAADAHVEHVWARLCAANPKLHDGPILSVTSFDPGAGRIWCKPDRYKRLAVQVDGGPETGVCLFAVKGIITALDHTSLRRVLMIRRHEHTRMYGGMWELGPAGGFDMLDSSAGLLGMDDLLVQIRKELREEAGISSPLANASLAAFFTDERAHSMDVVIQAELEEKIEQLRIQERDWDGAATLWLPVDDVEQFVEKERAKIADNTIGLMQLMGWIQ